MPFDLSGKVAVVNGASRGIGEAIAKGLADCRALVVLSSRRQESVQKVADEIVEAGGLYNRYNAGHRWRRNPGLR